MRTVSRYGRIQLNVPSDCEEVVFTTPSGRTERAMTFDYQPSRLVYDAHGYEHDEPYGEVLRLCRYSPDEVGVYHYAADGEAGEFECLPGDHPGYVQVSEKDPRYFATTDGHCFVPIGLNTCILRYDALPAGHEHFATGEGQACVGMISFRRWLKRLHENGGNYIRLWLSTPYLEARTEIPGVHNLAVFNRLDAVMDLAREYGLRVKMCFDHFRTFKEAGSIFYKRIVDVDTGKQLTDVDEWLTSEKWNRRWLEDVRPYVARYQNDPLVFSWEMWNEMPTISAKAENIDSFGARMMAEIKKWSPRNMVGNSQGSFDNMISLGRMKSYRDEPVYDYATVHRYLDQGARIEVCREDPAELCADGITQLLGGGKPLVLNETGAVNDCHTGPFRFYCCDHDGLIFHDVTYTPFFAGAAASGHTWHWEYYVDPQNLWKHFRPFEQMLQGIEADQEDFTPETMHTGQVLAYVLRGRKHTLIYLRNRADRWDHVLRDGIDTQPLEGVCLPASGRSVQAWWLMNEENEQPQLSEGWVTLPAFRHGCVLRLNHE